MPSAVLFQVNKTFLDVPISDHDRVGRLGAFWDSEVNRWYVNGFTIPPALRGYACRPPRHALSKNTEFVSFAVGVDLPEPIVGCNFVRMGRIYKILSSIFVPQGGLSVGVKTDSWYSVKARDITVDGHLLFEEPVLFSLGTNDAEMV